VRLNDAVASARAVPKSFASGMSHTVIDLGFAACAALLPLSTATPTSAATLRAASDFTRKVRIQASYNFLILGNPEI
jgi:hypothetical protein